MALQWIVLFSNIDLTDTFKNMLIYEFVLCKSGKSSDRNKTIMCILSFNVVKKICVSISNKDCNTLLYYIKEKLIICYMQHVM